MLGYVVVMVVIYVILRNNIYFESDDGFNYIRLKYLVKCYKIGLFLVIVFKVNVYSWLFGIVILFLVYCVFFIFCLVKN